MLGERLAGRSPSSVSSGTQFRLILMTPRIGTAPPPPQSCRVPPWQSHLLCPELRLTCSNRVRVRTWVTQLSVLASTGGCPSCACQYRNCSTKLLQFHSECSLLLSCGIHAAEVLWLDPSPTAPSQRGSDGMESYIELAGFIASAFMK